MPVRTAWEKMSAGDRESAVQDAVSIIQQDYYADVKGAADDIVEYLKEQFEEDVRGEPLREALIEHMHETIDAQSRVIYTFSAQLGLLVSENDGAYIEEYGAEGAVTDGALNWSAMMFAAMERDVYEELSRRNLDANNPESWFEEEEEEEE